MKHNDNEKSRSAYIAAAFDALCEKDQLYLEDLADQLAKIHAAAPETQHLKNKTERSEEGKVT